MSLDQIIEAWDVLDALDDAEAEANTRAREEVNRG
jgi:hypothetical protein